MGHVQAHGFDDLFFLRRTRRGLLLGRVEHAFLFELGIFIQNFFDVLCSKAGRIGVFPQLQRTCNTVSRFIYKVDGAALYIQQNELILKLECVYQNILQTGP